MTQDSTYDRDADRLALLDATLSHAAFDGCQNRAREHPLCVWLDEGPATAAFVIVHAVEGIIEAVTSREIAEAQEIARATALMVTAYVAAGR